MKRSFSMDRVILMLKRLYLRIEARAGRQETNAKRQSDRADQVDEIAAGLKNPQAAELARLAKAARKDAGEALGDAEEAREDAVYLRNIATLGKPENWRITATAEGLVIPEDEEEDEVHVQPDEVHVQPDEVHVQPEEVHVQPEERTGENDDRH